MDSDTGLINEGSGSSWYDAVNGLFASAGAPGYNGSVANPFEFMQNDPNMSQLGTGYNPSDAGSAVGLMSPGGSGGSTVPVYGGTQTLGLNLSMLAQIGGEYDEGLAQPAWAFGGGQAGGTVLLGNKFPSKGSATTTDGDWRVGDYDDILDDRVVTGGGAQAFETDISVPGGFRWSTRKYFFGLGRIYGWGGLSSANQLRLYAGSAATVTEGVTGWHDLAGKLDSQTDGSVKKLVIVGHGALGGIQASGGDMNAQNLSPEDARTIKKKLAKNAVVVIGGCQAAETPGDINQLTSLADMFDRPVVAYTGHTHGGVQGRGDGKWVIVYPSNWLAVGGVPPE